VLIALIAVATALILANLHCSQPPIAAIAPDPGIAPAHSRIIEAAGVRRH
jgi:hypothetical protein